jgi:hypothetical protein
MTLNINITNLTFVTTQVDVWHEVCLSNTVACHDLKPTQPTTEET